MTAKKNQKAEVAAEEAVTETEVAAEEALEPNKDGFMPGQPVTFEQVMAAQRKNRSKA